MKLDCTLTVVSVVTSADLLKSFLGDVVPVLDGCAKAYEVIAIANGLGPADLGRVREIVGNYRKIRLIVLSGEYPTDLAFAAGLETSIGDYVIVMDAACDPAEIIPDMLESALSGYDIVVASSRESRYGTGVQRLLSILYFKLMRYLLNLPEDIDPSYFTCFSRKAMTALARYKDTVRNYRFLRTIMTLPRHALVYTPIRRAGAQTRPLTLRRVLLATESFFSYSFAPLTLLSALSFVIGGLSFSYCGYALLSWAIRTQIESGWTSTALVNGIMFGSLFLILGVMAQYLALLIKEVRKFPLYLVTEDISTGTLFDAFDERNVVERGELERAEAGPSGEWPSGEWPSDE